MMDTFNGRSPHRPLSESDHIEIRLVKLYPGHFDDPVRCVLEHVSLATNPDFIALSYTWGDPTATSPILLDGQKYPVTTNLKSFLQHMQTLLYHTVRLCRGSAFFNQTRIQSVLQLALRNCPNGPPQDYSDMDSLSDISCTSDDSSVERGLDQITTHPSDTRLEDSPPTFENVGLYLWIDAICINQQDNNERNQQVYYMSDIYGSASCLFVWLGGRKLTQEAADSAFEFLLEILRRMSGKEIPRINHESIVQDVANDLIQNFEKMDAELQKESTSITSEEVLHRFHMVLAIAHLLMLPWFERIWIIQEFVLCRGPATVWYGFHHIPWVTLCMIGVFCQRSLLPLYGGMIGKHLTTGWSGGNASDLLQLYEWREDYRTVESSPNSLSSESLANKWLELLKITRSKFSATDHRDLVYGLQGLLPRSEIPLELRPNYQLPASELFHRCGIYLLKHSHGGLDFILSALKSSPGMPTWVPDWNTFPSDWDYAPKTVPTISVHPSGLHLVMDAVCLARVNSVVIPQITWNDPIAKESVADLSRELSRLENIIQQRLINKFPWLSAGEFQYRWKRLWEIYDEKTLHMYEVIVGRKQPQPPDLEASLYDSGIYLVAEKLSRTKGGGILILVDGNLVTNLKNEELIMEGDLVFMVKGVGHPCIFRRSESHYEFRGMCYGSTYDDNPPDEFYELGKMERIVVI